MAGFVIPSEIPWEHLLGKDLEESLYWLLDSMGARDLEWRVGGVGQGAPDQGRDLQASFYMADPSGQLERTTWWIEAKGRKGIVPSSAVKKAALDAAGNDAIDVLVVATNSTFSNPTRDWVANWQSMHPRPKVKLWAREDLERLVSQHPQVVIRLFSKALSPQGQVEVMKERFWRFTHYTDEPTLASLWKQRSTLDFDLLTLIAATASEFANGSITDRAWPLLKDQEVRINLLLSSLANSMSFMLRADEAGIRQEPYIQAMAYLMMLSLQALEPEALLSEIEAAFAQSFGGQSQLIQRIFLTSVTEQLRAELRDVCASDCRRVMMDPVELGQEGVEKYWDRNRLKEFDTEKDSHQFLIVEDKRASCKVGFPLGSEHTCPLTNSDCTATALDALRVFRAVLAARVPGS